jgi:DNA helicase-2/ATP-dependent DNA helicase PcrA
MMSAAELAASARDPFVLVVSRVYEEYMLSLRNNNAMDFDDLIVKPLELFLDFKDVLQRYQNRYRYILVDEYQDTNRVQYRLVKELAGAHRNLCVVGDDAQSIYAFRGADISNILGFQRDYPDAKVFRLEQNYRSTKTILAAADSVISHNSKQLKKKLWTENPDGDQVTLHICPDDREEGRRVVQCVEHEVSHRKLGLRDIAVLYRTNAQSRAIEDALRRAGLPYVIIGGVAFYRRKEIKDAIAYLRLIANPKDDESLLRIINVPSRKIGDTTLARLNSFARDQKLPLLDACRHAGLREALGDRAASAVTAFGMLIGKYAGLTAEMSPGEIARGLIEETGMLRELKEEGTPDATSRHDNIQELVSALIEFCSANPDATLDRFLEEVSLVADIDTADLTKNAVTLMTLHAAKGLEFPVVIITGLEEGLLPLGGTKDNISELEEERRLMYVGITRARMKLHLSLALTRFRYGESTSTTRSRFLDEIDAALIEQRGLSVPISSIPRSQGRDIFKAASSHRPPATRSVPAEHRSDPMPEYESESQDTPVPRMGAKVQHETFGYGKIVALEGKGEDARAIVDFEGYGRKRLMLKFANLKLR